MDNIKIEKMLDNIKGISVEKAEIIEPSIIEGYKPSIQLSSNGYNLENIIQIGMI